MNLLRESYTENSIHIILFWKLWLYKSPVDIFWDLYVVCLKVKFLCIGSESTYRLISNIRCTSNIRRTPTLGNSQLEFWLTITSTKTSNTRRTPSFDSWVSIVDKVWSRPTWSELLWVAWDFDSPWITAHQSVAYVRHIILAPAASLCTLSAIIFIPIKAWIWRHLRRYIDGSTILLTV